MKTIKQIADELGVDKQKVYRFIKRNHISEAHQKNSVMYYNDKAQTLIYSHFSRESIELTASEKALASASYDVILKQSEMLEKELDIKNEQIRELNARLAETTAALNVAQQSVRAAQLLHGGTMQKHLTGDNADDPKESEAPAVGFFSRIFGRKQA